MSDVSVLFLGESVSQVALPDASFFFSASSHESPNNIRCHRFVQEEGGCFSSSRSSSITIRGDPTRLIVDGDMILCSTSSGNLYKFFAEDTSEMRCEHTWDKLHNGVCSAFDCDSMHLISFGDDCKLCAISVDQPDMVQQYPDVAGCETLCCRFLTPSTLVSANIVGWQTLWDLRCMKKQHKFMLNNDETVATTCMDCKPDDHSIIGCGQEDGCLVMWDMRSLREPLAIHDGHDMAINDIAFHPNNSAVIFTASDSGELWQWCTGSSSATGMTLSESILSSHNSQNIWDSRKSSDICINSLLPESNAYPVTSVSVLGETVACSTVNQSVFVVNNVDIWQ